MGRYADDGSNTMCDLSGFLDFAKTVNLAG